MQQPPQFRNCPNNMIYFLDDHWVNRCPAFEFPSQSGDCRSYDMHTQVTAMLKVSNHKLFQRDLNRHFADLELTMSKESSLKKPHLVNYIYYTIYFKDNFVI